MVIVNFFLKKKSIKYNENILIIIDIIFISLIYCTSNNNEIFIIFYFVLVLYDVYNYGFKWGVIIFIAIVFFIYADNLLNKSLRYNLSNYIIIYFLIKPAAILLAFFFAEYFKSVNRECRLKNIEQKRQIMEKNKILSTLAHELRTPLTMINSSTEIILEGRPGRINKVQKEFLETILSNAVRLIKLVENILAKIKIESTWLKLDIKPIDIRPLFKKIVTNMSVLIRQKEQAIKYTYPKLMSKALGDENWLQQVMINLIYNASKHINEGGNIIVTIKENEQFIVVSVHDDGEGIDTEDREKIFNEYYMTDNSFKEDDSGVGLGLAIVKNVIENHNGKVYVGSSFGLGTTFSFTLQKFKKD